MVENREARIDVKSSVRVIAGAALGKVAHIETDLQRLLDQLASSTRQSQLSREQRPVQDRLLAPIRACCSQLPAAAQQTFVDLAVLLYQLPWKIGRAHV